MIYVYGIIANWKKNININFKLLMSVNINRQSQPAI